jgi:hypothetical protein
MANKTRNQNPVVGDTINLKLISRNSNNLCDLFNIDHVDIVRIDCSPVCDGEKKEIKEVIVQTIPGTSVERCSEGTYDIDLVTSAPEYIIGNYHDVWYVTYKEGDVQVAHRQDFKINPDLWVLSSTPVVYSFDFRFSPNRIRQGSKKWLIIKIVPNVPRATDLQRYYENIAISADLKISIEQNCGQCMPSEQDLRLIVDEEPVTERDKVFSYFQIDTTEWDCGLYNVWFELDFAGNIEISPKQQFQVF